MSTIEWQGRRRNSLSHNLQDTYSLEQMLKWQGDVKKNQEKLFEYKVKAVPDNFIKGRDLIFFF
jgi:hypothetical protein